MSILLEALEAEWEIENEVYKQMPSSYNEGWCDGFEAALEIVNSYVGRI